MQEEEESGPLSPPQLAQLHALPLDELLPLCELNIYCIVFFCALLYFPYLCYKGLNALML